MPRNFGETSCIMSCTDLYVGRLFCVHFKDLMLVEGSASLSQESWPCSQFQVSDLTAWCCQAEARQYEGSHHFFRNFQKTSNWIAFLDYIFRYAINSPIHVNVKKTQCSVKPFSIEWLQTTVLNGYSRGWESFWQGSHETYILLIVFPWEPYNIF